MDKTFYKPSDSLLYLQRLGYSVVYYTCCRTLYCNILACEEGLPQYVIETEYYVDEADSEHRIQYKLTGYDNFMQAVYLMKE